MSKISGSEALIKSLLAEDVKTIFGYPGGAIMPIYDALYDYQDQIKHILVRHEQAAAHAAEGFARMTGTPGVCFATSGPGATNLVTGIADAMMDSVPIVCITGQVASSSLGTDAFQETDVIGITIPITKWNYQVSRAAEIPEIIAKAFYIAKSGRPGPVLVDITKDAQFELIENFSYQRMEKHPTYFLPPAPKESLLAEAAKLINSAERPLILAGHGILISKAEKALVEFAEKSGIPVACTLHGLSSFPTGHANYVGMLGMHGNYGPNYLCNEADVVIAVGMRFDDRVTGKVDSYLPNSKIIHIEIDVAEIDKVKRAEIAICADAKVALVGLTKVVNQKTYSTWMQKFKACYEEEYKEVIGEAVNYKGDKPRMVQTIHMLSEKTEGKAVIVGDVGQHQMMAARYYQYQLPDSWITSGGLGTMGFALPAAMGAKVATDREVIAIIGDGCFQMTIQELATLAQDDIAVKVIVLNNNFLGMVRQWQELFFQKRYSFVELKNPNFVMVAEGMGVTASKVTDSSQLSEALDVMLAHKGPYVLEVVVEREDNVFPMVPAGQGVRDIRLK